jgi:hypothetical protein
MKKIILLNFMGGIKHNNLGPSKDRAMLRGLTYQGIADAMAEQWG